MSDNDRLLNDLVKLGDMMGDGLHLEPDGKWIEQSYKRICRQLGYIPKRKSNVKAINEGVKKAIAGFYCKANCCGSTSAKQTRSGAMRVMCTKCGTKYQLIRPRK